MKKLAFVCFAFLCLGRLSAQCPQEDIHLSSQFEVDTFGANWPNCEVIGGDLFLGKPEQIANIDNLLALSNIRHVEGSLTVRWNFFLENFHGLENLQSVGKTVAISENRRLDDLTGLSQLKLIGDSLDIFRNQHLHSLSGLDQLDTVRGSVIIHNNDSLPELNGLNHLRYIGKDLYIFWGEILVKLNAFQSLSFVGKDLRISMCERLIDLNEFNALTSIGENLLVTNCENIPDIDGFNSLTSIGKQLFLFNCWSLSDLSGFNILTTIGEDLHVNGCESLARVSGFNQLNTIGGDLILSDALPLTDLSGFASLDSIYGGLMIDRAFALQTFAGMESLRYAKSLGLWYNSELTDLTALHQLKVTDYIAILNSLYLDDFSGTTLFDGFTGELSLIFTGIKNVDFLSGVSSLKLLELRSNHRLANLSGLSNLAHIDSLIDISYNSSLHDISGFDHSITFTGETLFLFDNPALSDCAVEALCNWLNRPDPIDALQLSQNNTGCSTIEEVTEACQTDGFSGPAVWIWPNPARSQIDVFVQAPDEEITVQVWDATGQLVLQSEAFVRNTQLDVSFLTQGIYFIGMQGESKTRAGRFVKI